MVHAAKHKGNPDHPGLYFIIAKEAWVLLPCNDSWFICLAAGGLWVEHLAFLYFSTFLTQGHGMGNYCWNALSWKEILLAWWMTFWKQARKQIGQEREKRDSMIVYLRTEHRQTGAEGHRKRKSKAAVQEVCCLCGECFGRTGVGVSRMVVTWQWVMQMWLSTKWIPTLKHGGWLDFFTFEVWEGGQIFGGIAQFPASALKRTAFV